MLALAAHATSKRIHASTLTTSRLKNKIAALALQRRHCIQHA